MKYLVAALAGFTAGAIVAATSKAVRLQLEARTLGMTPSTGSATT